MHALQKKNNNNNNKKYNNIFHVQLFELSKKIQTLRIFKFILTFCKKTTTNLKAENRKSTSKSLTTDQLAYPPSVHPCTHI